MDECTDLIRLQGNNGTESMNRCSSCVIVQPSTQNGFPAKKFGSLLISCCQTRPQLRSTTSSLIIMVHILGWFLVALEFHQFLELNLAPRPRTLSSYWLLLLENNCKQLAHFASSRPPDFFLSIELLPLSDDEVMRSSSCWAHRCLKICNSRARRWICRKSKAAPRHKTRARQTMNECLHVDLLSGLYLCTMEM